MTGVTYAGYDLNLVPGWFGGGKAVRKADSFRLIARCPPYGYGRCQI